MKERPILFNTAMVQAILSGRKTQTRRVAQVGYEKGMKGPVVRGKTAVSSIHFRPGLDDCCPFGERGDWLWVRESFRLFNSSNECGCSESPCGCPRNGTPIYRATHDDGESKWKPSIHMPRSACRIILEITALRIERLQDISESDALAEGIQSFYGQGDAPQCFGIKAEYCGFGTTGSWNFCSTPVEAFKQLWYSTGGQWSANPWVWVIEFKVLTTNGVVPEVAA